jgi:hypothetical protein
MRTANAVHAAPSYQLENGLCAVRLARAFVLLLPCAVRD